MHKYKQHTLALGLFISIVCSSQPLQADELQISISKATSAKSLSAISKDLSVIAQDPTGLTIVDTSEIAAQAITDTESSSEDSVEDDVTPVFTDADDYIGETFTVGDYAVICFTPPVNLHIRIMDTAPNGKEGQIFPIDGKNIAHKVKAGMRYCVGDEHSDTLLQMDSGSGTGKGTVWIIGTATAAQAGDLDIGEFSLPETWEISRSPAGSKMAGKNKIEGWIDYEVK